MKSLIISVFGIIILTSMSSAMVAYTHTDATESYDLLIVAPSQFAADLQPLIDHKTSVGVATTFKSVEDIYDEYDGYDDAEDIKLCIADVKEQSDITYVLLVGGRKPSLIGEQWLLPARYSHIEDNIETPEMQYVSDLYFADLYDAVGNFSSWDTNENHIYGEWYTNQSAGDIIDLYPDVFVGRLPCRNTFEVKLMVQKIIDYESQPADPAWFNKMVVAGGDTYTDNGYFEGEVANQQALDWMPGFEPVKLWTSDGSLESWKDVVSTINNGCGFLYFAGHGSPAAWGTHPPYDDSIWIFGLKLRNMLFLRNNEKLPVCVVGGCHNSMFNISVFHNSWTFGLPIAECWSWSLTRHVNGGTIATIGCTGLGYGKEDKVNPELGGGGDWLDCLFFKSYGLNGKTNLGAAWGDAITMYLDQYPIDYNQLAFADTALDAKTVQEWALIGDPSLMIGGYT
jgi:hypothetical protein